jgi:uncharacterized protein (TIGR03437 family)
VYLFSVRTNYFSILNAASGRPGPVAPGSLIAVKGSFTSEIMFPLAGYVYYSFDGVSVQLDGVTIQMYACNTQQVEVAIPQGASPGVHTLTVTVNGTVELTGEITVTPRNLAAFTWSPDPNNPQNLSPQITNPSGQLVGNPALSSSYVQASSGDVLTLTGTGAGTTAPVLNDNTVSPPPGTAVCNFGPSVNFDESTYSPVVSCRWQAGSFSIDTIQFTAPNGLASGPHSIIVEGSYGSVVYKNAVWLK